MCIEESTYEEQTLQARACKQNLVKDSQTCHTLPQPTLRRGAHEVEVKVDLELDEGAHDACVCVCVCGLAGGLSKERTKNKQKLELHAHREIHDTKV